MIGAKQFTINHKKVQRRIKNPILEDKIEQKLQPEFKKEEISLKKLNRPLLEIFNKNKNAQSNAFNFSSDFNKEKKVIAPANIANEQISRILKERNIVEPRKIELKEKYFPETRVKENFSAIVIKEKQNLNEEDISRISSKVFADIRKYLELKNSFKEEGKKLKIEISL